MLTKLANPIGKEGSGRENVKANDFQQETKQSIPDKSNFLDISLKNGKGTIKVSHTFLLFQIPPRLASAPKSTAKVGMEPV
jgi:hypothetical protein